MMHSARCEKLRDEMKALRAGLEEVMELLSSDSESKDLARFDETSDAGLDFFGEIVQSDDQPEDEELFRKVLSLIIDLGYASTIVLQHRLEISYRQAASIIADLERAELIDHAHGFRPHKVLPAAFDLHYRLEEENLTIETSK
jgi:DNA segregation ATPase FtsK/SpoIIIE-like protein